MQLFDTKIITTLKSNWGIRKDTVVGIYYYLWLFCLISSSQISFPQATRADNSWYLHMHLLDYSKPYFSFFLSIIFLEKKKDFKLPKKKTPSFLVASYCKIQLPKSEAERSKLKPDFCTFYNHKKLT